MKKNRQELCDLLDLSALVLIALGGAWNIWSYLRLGTPEATVTLLIIQALFVLLSFAAWQGRLPWLNLPVAVFGFVYVALVLLGSMLISFDNRFDIVSNFTASLTCVSNIGPCFDAGAAGFAEFGGFSKVVMSILMLAGRLELFPILAFFHPDVWRGV